MIKKNHSDKDLEGAIVTINGLTGVPRAVDEFRLGLKGKVIQERFIGPTPVRWWREVLDLPKCAIQVASVVMFLRGLRKSDRFRLEPARFRELGVSLTSKKRGLSRLEAAGLILVERARGRAPIVEVVLSVELEVAASVDTDATFLGDEIPT